MLQTWCFRRSRAKLGRAMSPPVGCLMAAWARDGLGSPPSVLMLVALTLGPLAMLCCMAIRQLAIVSYCLNQCTWPQQEVADIMITL